MKRSLRRKKWKKWCNILSIFFRWFQCKWKHMYGNEYRKNIVPSKSPKNLIKIENSQFDTKCKKIVEYSFISFKFFYLFLLNKKNVIFSFFGIWFIFSSSFIHLTMECVCVCRYNIDRHNLILDPFQSSKFFYENASTEFRLKLWKKGKKEQTKKN